MFLLVDKANVTPFYAKINSLRTTTRSSIASFNKEEKMKEKENNESEEKKNHINFVVQIIRQETN